MLKVPTRRATPAKINRNVDRAERNPLVTASRFSFVSWAPVMVSARAEAGTAARTRAASVSWLTPGAARTSTREISAGSLVRWSAAPSAVKPTKVEVPKPSAVPKVAMPTIVTRTGSGVSTMVVPPTARWPDLAAPRLMTTSSAPAGARPWTRR